MGGQADITCVSELTSYCPPDKNLFPVDVPFCCRYSLMVVERSLVRGCQPCLHLRKEQGRRGPDDGAVKWMREI